MLNQLPKGTSESGWIALLPLGCFFFVAFTLAWTVVAAIKYHFYEKRLAQEAVQLRQSEAQAAQTLTTEGAFDDSLDTLHRRIKEYLAPTQLGAKKDDS